MSSEITQFELSNSPTDGITRIKFCNSINRLIVSSWDKSVTLYEIQSPNTRVIHSYEHNAGVLDCSITQDDMTMLSVGCDHSLQSCDVKTASNTTVGYHNMPIRCVEYNNENNIIVTGSWDKTIKLWDIRSGNANNNRINNNQNKACISSHELSNKVFAMSTSGNRIIVGVGGRQVYIFDIRKMNDIEQKRESSLKHQTRCIVTHPNKEQYVLSSVEGRVAVEYFDINPNIQNKKYAFKCHRITDKITSQVSIFPVNTIAFHPIYKTFATGGGDGIVNTWDGDNKKKICQFPSFATSISSLSFNHDGSMLAIAQSYTWEQGDIVRPKDAIYIRHIKESEVKPKPKTK